MATLKFMPAGQFEGFRTSGLSAYNDGNAEIIVRELVQNALDASVQAGRKTDVRFEIETVPVSEIPARELYQAHFEQSVATQRRAENLDQVEDMVTKIRDTLSAERLHVLWVSDCGIGLNPKNMHRLLSDGQTGKSDPRSAGSYGNGHMTAFPASDLQYIIYGAVCERERYAAGHVILASHELKGKSYAKDGFLVDEIRDDLFDRFIFYRDNKIPKLISNKLDIIAQKSETGSVVGILGFNDFLEDDSDPVARIESVIATHFSPAIQNGDMSIEITRSSFDNQIKKTINSGRLSDVLIKDKSRLGRRWGQKGPSGYEAWEILQTLKSGSEEVVHTSFGSATILFREFEVSGSTKIHLFRNGMWITDKLPKMSPRDFGNARPFHAIVLLGPDGAADACDLIRKSEGPSHIHIERKRMRNRGDKGNFDKFFGELHSGIREFTTELDAEEFDPGFFSIDVSGAGIAGRQVKLGVGRPEPADPPSPPHTVNPNKKKRKRRKKAAGVRVEARYSALRLGGGVRVQLKPLEDADETELRLTVASGADTTCDNPIPASRLKIGPDSTISGKPADVRPMMERKVRWRSILAELLPMALPWKSGYPAEMCHLAESESNW